MKKNILLAGILALACVSATAQVGAPYIHDPSTIQLCDGKYYTFGTGGGGLISADGWTWESGAVRPGGGAAPDAIKIGDRYLVGYSATGGGLGGGHAGRILTMWNKTLDPNSPDFAYTEPIEVAHSEMDEDCDAIDIGLLMDPDGRLFCTYGTYFGNIRMVELDPATGARLPGNKAVDVAIDCEASVMIYNDGWYYLLGTHGTCCDGVNSTYNIVVGPATSRSRAWRRCPSTGRATWTAAAAASSPSVRSCGRTVGRRPASPSRTATTRSSAAVAVTRWN